MFAPDRALPNILYSVSPLSDSCYLAKPMISVHIKKNASISLYKKYPYHGFFLVPTYTVVCCLISPLKNVGGSNKQMT